MKMTDKDEEMFENDERTDLMPRTSAERVQLCPSQITHRVYQKENTWTIV